MINFYVSLKKMLNSFKERSHKTHALTDMQPIKVDDYAYP